MENQSINYLVSAGVGGFIWGISKFLRSSRVKNSASRALDDLSNFQFGGGSGREYDEVVATTNISNVLVPALIGILTAIAAVLAELKGNHHLAIGLLAVSLPHLAEIKLNQRIISDI